VRARAQLTAAAPRAVSAPADGCRLAVVRDAPPVAFRATPEAVYLVGTAASPVGDDKVVIDVEVEAGAALMVRSAASMIAWASAGSSLEVNVSVGPGGYLDWHLQPMIASAGCSFSQRVTVKLADGAALRWTEEIVLGRHAEQPGRLSLRLDVDIDDNPLLRHQLELGPGVPGWDGPAVLGPNRAVGLAFLTTTGAAHGGPATPSLGTGTGKGWAVMALEGPGILISAVGPDLARLRLGLDEALSRCLATPSARPGRGG
jgi:urease accessory protein